jgi:hypothetical protein
MKCEAIRSRNVEILHAREARLTTRWVSQSNIQVPSPGHPSQCPNSVRPASCYLTINDSDSDLIVTYSTSSTLVVALGPGFSLPLEHTRRLGQETEIWRTGSCGIAQMLSYSVCYLSVSVLSPAQVSLAVLRSLCSRQAKRLLRGKLLQAMVWREFIYDQSTG